MTLWQKIIRFFWRKTTFSCYYCNEPVDVRLPGIYNCPSCNGRLFFVRGREKKRLATVNIVDRVNRKIGKRYFELKYKPLLQEIGITDHEFRYKKKKWKGLEKKSGMIDLFWQLLEERAAVYNEKNDFTMLQKIYYVMALLLSEQEKDCHDLLKQAAFMQLLDFKKLGFTVKVKILTATDSSCENCKKLQGKVLTIDEAILKMPIPNKNCNNNYRFCKCRYVVEKNDTAGL